MMAKADAAPNLPVNEAKMFNYYFSFNGKEICTNH